MITTGPSETVKKGPVLCQVSFPEVLVAKAYSHDGHGMELVLYPGKQSGKFALGFERLQSGQTYRLGEQTAVVSKDGKASFEVMIDGRTAVQLERVGSK